jgi:hypothetical protein
MLQEHGCSTFDTIKAQGLLDSMLPPQNVFCVTEPTPFGMSFCKSLYTTGCLRHGFFGMAVGAGNSLLQ